MVLEYTKSIAMCFLLFRAVTVERTSRRSSLVLSTTVGQHHGLGTEDNIRGSKEVTTTV